MQKCVNYVEMAYYSWNTCCPFVILCVSRLGYFVIKFNGKMNEFQFFGIYSPLMATYELEFIVFKWLSLWYYCCCQFMELQNLDDWALIDLWIIFAQLVTIELLQLLANFILIYFWTLFLPLFLKYHFMWKCVNKDIIIDSLMVHYI